MAWCADESPCDYFGDNAAAVLRAVGWIERGQPFPLGNCDPNVYSRLKECFVDCWQPVAFGGFHACDLCQFDAEAVGSKNLFIPGDGFLYVCPELIVHYINAHSYAPPPDFCRCLLECPPMKSMDYRRALLAKGGRILMQAIQGWIQGPLSSG